MISSSVRLRGLFFFYFLSSSFSGIKQFIENKNGYDTDDKSYGNNGSDTSNSTDVSLCVCMCLCARFMWKKNVRCEIHTHARTHTHIFHLYVCTRPVDWYEWIADIRLLPLKIATDIRCKNGFISERFGNRHTAPVNTFLRFVVSTALSWREKKRKYTYHWREKERERKKAKVFQLQLWYNCHPFLFLIFFFHQDKKTPILENLINVACHWLFWNGLV